MHQSRTGRALTPASGAADVTAADILARCPYQTLLGANIEQRATPEETFEAAAERIGCMIAVMGGSQPEPMSAPMMSEVLDVLAQGWLVLLVSDRADLRDFAKREIRAMAGPPMGYG